MKIRDKIAPYLTSMKALGRAYHTIRCARYDLMRFCRYLESEGILNVADLSLEVLEDYQEDLSFSLTAKGKPLSLKTQEKRLCTVKGFTRYLTEKDYLVNDPGRHIKLPKMPRRLPRLILNPSDVKRLMATPDMRTSMGYRDRVVLEILYDTAIRRSEMARIRLPDLDLNGGYIRITGKGEKERVVPVSRRVCELVKNYILSVRPAYVRGKDPWYLLLNPEGKAVNVHLVWQIVRRNARLSGVKKHVTPHTFRHTCATHMLKNGAPIRHLQEMLGHESLESTQIYTHVTINDLKQVHARYHPGENME